MVASIKTVAERHATAAGFLVRTPRSGDGRSAFVAHHQRVASAADAINADLLLRLLASANWDVTLDRAACGSFALAVLDVGRSPLRITAFAKTRDAAVLLLFEQACAHFDERRMRGG
jgi:hypothetical protein